MELVSIVVPVYNTRVCYLSQCIETLVRQTYTNIEIIIVDDGSTLPETCQYFTNIIQSNTARVVSQNNQGASMARRTGINEANGKYLMFVDADDMCHISLVERLVELIEQNDAEMSEVSYKEYLPREKVDFEKDVERTESLVLYKNRIMENVLYSYGYPITWGNCGKLFLTQKLKSVFHGYTDICRGEDLVNLVEYCLECSKIVCCNEGLYFYNKGNAESTTALKDVRQCTIADAWMHIEEICTDRVNEDMQKKIGVTVIENINFAVSLAALYGAEEKVKQYADTLKHYRKYYRYLGEKSYLKTMSILYASWLYVLKAHCKEG